MKIEEAIVYVLAKRNGGLKTDQIEEVINRERLFVCKDGRPVSSAFVYRTPRVGYSLPDSRGERGMLVFPDYTQDNDLWIRLQDYQHEDWPTLVQLWQCANRHSLTRKIGELGINKVPWRALFGMEAVPNSPKF